MIIQCMTCARNGIKQNLAALNPDGTISIRRRRSLRAWDQTIVIGEQFGLACGNCLEVAYVRKEASAGTSNGIERILGISVVQTLGTA